MPRSLLLMHGDARSAWRHGIAKRQTDEPLAEYLMSSLAPAPLSDLVTKDFLRSELEKYRTDAAAQLAAFRTEVKNQFRWLVGIGVMILGVIVAFGAVS